MKTHITLLPRDITTGIQHDDIHCPVAKAINRAFKRKVKASVGTSIFTLYRGLKQVEGRLPEKASHFIFSFDAGDKPEPITFVLNHKAI